jgi:glutaryl-CoA dehydrogenase
VPHNSFTRIAPDALFDIDSLLDDEEREIRRSVRSLVQRSIAPEIATWYDIGELPVRELARELGELGLLGMHLQG